MKGIPLRFAIVLPLGLLAVGCTLTDPQSPATSSVTGGAGPYGRGDIGSLTYRAVDHLLAEAPEIAVGTPLVVGTISEVQNVESTTALGNIVADMIRTRLSQDGHTVSEIRETLNRAVRSVLQGVRTLPGQNTCTLCAAARCSLTGASPNDRREEHA